MADTAEATICLQVFLVGDPIQLPATVISKRAVSFGYDGSLFKRLQTAGYPVQVLDTQYRMHPDICRFPSNQFYAGGVKTGEGVEEATRRPWHAQRVGIQAPVLSFVTYPCLWLRLIILDSKQGSGVKHLPQVSTWTTSGSYDHTLSPDEV